MYGRRSWGTFSIVAGDADRKYWGVEVSTKPLAVGAVVPWAEWRVGAIATKAMSNYRYGPDGLALLRKGPSAAEGGDRRGIESAALLVVHRRPWFEAAWGDQWLNLRVDQHRRPIVELERLVGLEEANPRNLVRWHAAQVRKRRPGAA